MVWKYFFGGVIVKLVTGFDDTLTHVPLISYLTKTRKGKVAFGVGIFLAICVAIVVAVFFSSLIKGIPNYRYIVGGLLFALAFVIYFDVFRKDRVKDTEMKMKKVQRAKPISNKRFLKLVVVGFVAAFATLLDDIIAYSSLLLGQGGQMISGIGGILVAGVLEISVIVFFSKKLAKFEWRKEIASVGLLILGVLVMRGII
jgi:magnesium-transporting ATPase (P-type)